jgi:2'-5' RNA ligase
MSTAIVAIPAADSHVWNLSSEKVPHLTLLFLGDELNDYPYDLTTYLDGMASSFHSFFLPVERRGLLGDKDADVLFFDKNAWQSEYAEKIRAYLLAHPVIRDAYDSVEQFPQWIPHLTLGYPDSPAKPDGEQAYPYPGILSIEFDRIALWTGDYEGVEFPLSVNELSMSERGAEFIKHYGVKGMKWGVIRDRGKAAGTAYKKLTVSDDAVAAKKVKGKAKVVGVDALTNKDLQTVITRMNLEMQYSQLKKVEHEQSLLGKGKKWAGNFVSDVLKDAAASWLKRPGSNFSGRTSGRARNFGGGSVIDGSFSPAAIGS